MDGKAGGDLEAVDGLEADQVVVLCAPVSVRSCWEILSVLLCLLDDLMEQKAQWS